MILRRRVPGLNDALGQQFTPHPGPAHNALALWRTRCRDAPPESWLHLLRVPARTALEEREALSSGGSLGNVDAEGNCSQPETRAEIGRGGKPTGSRVGEGTTRRWSGRCRVILTPGFKKNQNKRFPLVRGGRAGTRMQS